VTNMNGTNNLKLLFHPFLVMGPGQKYLTWVGLGHPSLVWVWHLKISLKNPKFFNFLPFGSKKISLGQAKKYLCQSRVSLLFTAGQKYARVRSGPIFNPFHDDTSER